VIRVLHVLSDLRYSGAEIMLSTAAQRWREAGVSGDVVATGRWVGPYAVTLRAVGYPVHHVPFRPSPRFLLDMRRLVEEERFDVVHQHSEHAAFWVGLAVRTTAPVVVRTIHSVFEYDGWLRLERSWQRRISRAMGVRMAAVGPSVADNELRRFGNAVEIVPNWLDTAHYRPPEADERKDARARLGLSDDTVAIVTVGNCRDVKNHGAVIRALSALQVDRPVHYLHAGQEREPADERELATIVGVSDRCEFLGHIEDVRGLLWAADVFVMPSLYEGLGLAAVEALASGTAAVLADVPGLRDLKRAFGGSGAATWVEPSAQGVAAGVEWAMEAARHRTPREYQHAHAVADEHFGLSAGADRYVDLYRAGLRPGTAR
jgi:glycosyltransferase involved in cell wall biosynthesis